MTSKSAGPRQQMHGGGVHQQMLHLHVAVVFGDGHDGAPPQTHGGQHVGLVDRGQFAAPTLRRAKGHVRHPLDFVSAVKHGVVGAVAIAGFLTFAEIDSAGQFAHEEHVHAFQQVRPQGRMLDQRRPGLHRPQVGEEAEVLANLQKTLLGAHAGVGVRPFRAADGAHQDGIGLFSPAQRIGGQGLPPAVDGDSAHQGFLEAKIVAEALRHASQGFARLRRYLRANAISWQDQYVCRCHRHSLIAIAASVRSCGATGDSAPAMRRPYSMLSTRASQLA